MRLQHLKQIVDGLAAGDPARAAAKAVIVAEVDRLHWRICNWLRVSTSRRICLKPAAELDFQPLSRGR
jgi:hypothetical protein